MKTRQYSKLTFNLSASLKSAKKISKKFLILKRIENQLKSHSLLLSFGSVRIFWNSPDKELILI